MRNIIIVFVFTISLTFSISAQTNEARKIAEFSKIPCGFFESRVDSAFHEHKNSPGSKIYVIYYEELNHLSFINGSKEATLVNPRRGNARNRAKEVPLFLKTVYKLPKDKVVLLDGGFRKDFELEIWIVPKDAKLPKLSPTVDEKNVRFGKGKPVRTRDCARAYDGIK